MEASSGFLNSNLRNTKMVYARSGFKIQFSKAKVIRLGNIRATFRRLGRENGLDWVTNITGLGIQCDILNMNNITNINCIVFY